MKGPAMSLPSVQLSHEELLLTLGMLRLPMPLALGEQPIAGYDDKALNAALTSAMSSLMARDLITNDEPPQINPDLRDLVTVSALAEGCLMVAASHGKATTVTHFSRQGDKLVVHTSPRERVHRLAALNGSSAITDQVIAWIVPHVPVDSPLSFSIPTSAFGLALDALDSGQLDIARRIMVGAGLAPNLADTFINRAGTKLTRYVFVAFTNLQQPQPSAQTMMVVQGLTETWYVVEDGKPETLRVQTVDPQTLTKHVAAFVQLIA